MGRPGKSRDVRLGFWVRIRAGVSVKQACRDTGVHDGIGGGWFRQAGGVISNAPQPVSGRYLSLVEREEIAVGVAAGKSVAQIGRELGRDRSTIGRELARNGQRRGYRAGNAQQKTDLRARRPKVAKLAAHPALRDWVQAGLTARWSPQQISVSLRGQFPDRPEMWVSHETIYQSIYVQGRGALRRELAVCLRTGRALRRPHRAVGARRPAKIPNMVMISQRPAEAADRAVPGHWEGDLIIGRNGASQIGTLVERSTRYCLLLHLPQGKDAATVAQAMITTIATLPAQLRRSITWDQGAELARHQQITLATDMAIYFCDPHSPWQRGSNENTNGLLRQYFPKSTDLSVHSAEHLAAVATELNDRPRHTLDWRSPTQALHELLSTPPDTDRVATIS
jgi:IS30 family transposase